MKKINNQNESLNRMNWNCIPKEVFVQLELLEFGMFEATSQFNYRSKAVMLYGYALWLCLNNT